MKPVNRREFAAITAAGLVAGVARSAPAKAQETGGGMFVCMHGATGSMHDFQTTMEGWARAGIRAVEPDLPNVRQFTQRESPQAARRMLDDLGLRAVSSSNALFLEETGPRRAQAMEDLRWKVELAEAIGADRLVAPSAASDSHTIDDYPEVIDNLREAADIAAPHGVTLMVEFTRLSTLISNLRTALMVVRAADHPNLKVMLDTFHFWSGMSKFEDLDRIADGELHHLHFEDVPDDPPLEVFGQPDRVFPGEGIAPLDRIVEVIRSKGYAGPASLEMFSPQVRAMDPYDQAMRARQTIEPYIL
jgi:sugar phosphate isomerase/epimerase